ncbi:MAG TPA: hypothetical protein VD978_23910 [Azospirillum sp.]|nr:hypothetical protein [Azospirillum sp.]
MAAPGKPSFSTGHAAGNGSIVLLLSLFLLLLVFFIVLNAQSVQAVSRVKAAMGSLERSFHVDPRLRDGDDPVASRAGTVFAAERLNGVGDLFATAISVAKVTTVSPGQLMEVRLAADELFEPGTADVRRDRQGLIDRVTDGLRESRAGEHIELDALLAISPSGPGQAPGPIERAGAFARTLVANGAPAERVTVGIERGEPGTARLLFSIRSAEDKVPGKSGSGGRR